MNEYEVFKEHEKTSSHFSGDENLSSHPSIAESFCVLHPQQKNNFFDDPFPFPIEDLLTDSHCSGNVAVRFALAGVIGIDYESITSRQAFQGGNNTAPFDSFQCFILDRRAIIGDNIVERELAVVCRRIERQRDIVLLNHL